MDKKLKAKWVRALRSGRYVQGRSYLYLQYSHCCLGVLGRVHGLSDDDLRGCTMPSEMTPESRNKFPKLGGKVLGELATLNDTGVPFEMIAGLIDSAL